MNQKLMQGSNKNHNYKHYFKHHETVFYLLNRVTGTLHPRKEIHRNFTCTPMKLLTKPRLDSQSLAWQGPPASGTEMAAPPAHHSCSPPP